MNGTLQLLRPWEDWQEEKTGPSGVEVVQENSSRSMIAVILVQGSGTELEKDQHTFNASRGEIRDREKRERER